MGPKREKQTAETKMAHLFKSEGNSINPRIAKEQLDTIDEIADQRGISRAELLRQWCYIGWRMDKDIDLELESNTSQYQSTSDPCEKIFGEHLPDNPDDALRLNELEEEIKSKVERKVQKLYRNYESLEFADNGGVYKNEE
jgi:hypothetical protein